MKEVIAELRRLKATPAPWWSDGRSFGALDGDGYGIIDVGETELPEDATFIAVMRNAISELLKALEEAQNDSVEAPERIWAASVTDSYGEWQTVKDGLPRPVEYVRADKLEELAAALVEKDKEIAAATAYAENLASALHEKYYAEVSAWRPLSGDLIGLLTQIDNMTSALARNAGGKDGE